MCDFVKYGFSASSSTADMKSEEMQKSKSAIHEQNAKAYMHVLNSHKRLNFLHQAAVHLSFQSSDIDDGYAKLARRYTKLFRDVLKTERVRRCELTLVKRKIIQSKCILCGCIRNYEWNTDYLSRNQKYWANDHEAVNM
ncbi:hypothetical protein DICVIV_01090 [Dictyocaulus viviparus]|uniref:Uncharacterized protein n=1 Tax=Dictyocaulus viviparus TaxID=29172 RepID=A0A0D8YDR8_DICVI|nr:hypothetical protein DICVIV_01090 [Dictyocaulus viviparus]